MPAYYNKPKENSKFAVINTIENSRVVMSEAIYKVNDNYVTIFGWMDTCSDLKSVNGAGDYEPQLCQFNIVAKSYSTQYKDKNGQMQTSSKVPSKSGLWIIECLKCLDSSKPYKLIMDFSAPEPMIQALSTGLKYDGTPMSEAEKSLLLPHYFDAIPTELDKLKDIDLGSEGKKPYYSNVPKGQTRLEQLNDNVAFLIAVSMPDSDYRKWFASVTPDVADKDSEFNAHILGLSLIIFGCP